MWGKPPFWIADNAAIDVRNLATAREWYKEKLESREAQTGREDDSDRPFADLCILGAPYTFVSLAEMAAGATPATGHVIFFAGDLEKAHQWLAGRGISVDPATTDSGGNRFFRFRDLDGNAIEVCVEPD